MEKNAIVNIGEARWKDGKDYPVRYAIPIDSCNGNVILVKFEDNDWAILDKSELQYPIKNQLDHSFVKRFYASQKARNTLRNSYFIKDDLSGLKELLNIFTDLLNSYAVDPTGEINGKPLFVREEKEISSQLAFLITMKQSPGICCAFSQEKYPASGGLCDIVLLGFGKRFWIEIKQSWEKTCTDWETVKNNKNNKFLKDIDKLNALPTNTLGMILHIAYRPISDFPDDFPVHDLMEALEGHPYEWRHFSMPTKDHGPCVCHLIAWLIR